MTQKTSSTYKSDRSGPGTRLGTWLVVAAMVGALAVAGYWRWPAIAGANFGQTTGAEIPPSSEMRQLALEKNLERRMIDMLAALFGRENVRVNLRADMDFTARQTVTEAFDPDSQVARSSVNLQGGALSASTDEPGQFEQRVEFEISKSTSTIIEDEGRIKKLSAAILINSEADGVTAERLAEIEPVLRAAIGMDESRDDRLEIARLPFSGIDPARQGNLVDIRALTSPKSLVTGGLALAILLALAAYGLLRKRGQNASAGIAPSAATPDVASPSTANRALDSEVFPDPALSTSELRVRVAQLVDQNPDRALAIMRSWLHERATGEGAP